MGLVERVAGWLGHAELLETRAIDSFASMPGLTEQLLAIQGVRDAPWRMMSVREALSVPAVFRSVHMSASQLGSIPLRGYRDGALVNPTPRLLARPNPFEMRRPFYYGLGFNMATFGESILYAAAEDVDRQALTVLNLPLREVKVDWADDRQVERVYAWREKPLESRRVRHLMYVCEPGALRGVGPLQLIGAAVSVAAEADEWAARYFGESGVTSTHLHSETKLSDAEADVIKQRWLDQHSAVRVTSGGVMTAQPLGVNPRDAQLIESRLHSRGEMAVSFGMPGKLLEYSNPGASLTYENVGDVMTEFARMTLTPDYLVPIEEAFTDFLPRAMTARFDLDQLQRPDPETRWAIHKIATEIGAYDAAYAAMLEGIEPGALATAPVAPAGPAPGGIPSAQAAGIARVR